MSFSSGGYIPPASFTFNYGWPVVTKSGRPCLCPWCIGNIPPERLTVDQYFRIGEGGWTW